MSINMSFNITWIPLVEFTYNLSYLFSFKSPFNDGFKLVVQLLPTALSFCSSILLPFQNCCFRCPCRYYGLFHVNFPSVSVYCRRTLIFHLNSILNDLYTFSIKRLPSLIALFMAVRTLMSKFVFNCYIRCPIVVLVESPFTFLPHCPTVWK